MLQSVKLVIATSSQAKANHILIVIFSGALKRNSFRTVTFPEVDGIEPGTSQSSESSRTSLAVPPM